MRIKLSPTQARVIGVLMEKELTTPEQYPLSLNSVTLGCNQKSNREPVMQLSESEVQSVLDELDDMRLLFIEQGSRVPKYKHRFCNTEFSDLKFSSQEFAIICVLLLRGPQTPGELRTRTNRLAEFNNVQEVERSLQALGNFNGDALVVRLEREAGKRESRYAHTFCGDIDAATSTPLESHASPAVSAPQADLAQAIERIEALEHQVAELFKRLGPN